MMTHERLERPSPSVRLIAGGVLWSLIMIHPQSLMAKALETPAEWLALGFENEDEEDDEEEDADATPTATELREWLKQRRLERGDELPEGAGQPIRAPSSSAGAAKRSGHARSSSGRSRKKAATKKHRHSNRRR